MGVVMLPLVRPETKVTAALDRLRQSQRAGVVVYRDDDSLQQL